MYSVHGRVIVVTMHEFESVFSTTLSLEPNVSTHLHCHMHVHARYLLEAEEETGTYTHFCPSSSRMPLWSLGCCLRSSPVGSPTWLAQAADSLFGCVPGHQQNFNEK